jgi:hypothetical protein
MAERLARRLRSLVAAALAGLAATAVVAYADSADNAAASGQPVTTEVERLRELLRRYHASRGDEAQAPASEAPQPATPAMTRERLEALLDTPFSAHKVLLHPREYAELEAELRAHLDDTSLPGRRHDTALIATLRTRADGALRARSSHSLRHLGRHCFAGIAAVVGGRSSVSIGEYSWDFELPAAQAEADYLLTLYAPPTGDWDLHVISRQALPDAPRPAWLDQVLQTPADAP